MERILELGARGQDVRELQQSLRSLGASIRAAEDGVYDAYTRDAVEAFQLGSFLDPDGRAGPKTCAVLVAEVTSLPLTELRDYRGRWGFLLREEGHRGYPYCLPGEREGITLDPGFSLAHQSEHRLRDAYGHSLRSADLAALVSAVGARGALARGLVNELRIARVRITREIAARALPRIAASFWRELGAMCPALLRPSTPAAVHAALLSLAYNAGSDDVKPLCAGVASGDWAGIAALMEQMHSGAANERRRREAALLRPRAATPPASRPRPA